MNVRVLALSVFVTLAASCAARRAAPESPLPEGAASTSPLPDTLSPGVALIAISAATHAAPPAGDALPGDVLVPVGEWVRLGPLTGFTYVDPHAGLSVRGYIATTDLLEDAASLGDFAGGESAVTIRLGWRPPQMEVLSDAERTALGLPTAPDWLTFYGPQPPAGTLHGEWRLYPELRERFLEEYPDDLQVIVYDGRTPTPPMELIWVRVLHCDPPLCSGRLLNQPFALKSLREGDEVVFDIQAPADSYPLLVSHPGK